MSHIFILTGNVFTLVALHKQKCWYIPYPVHQVDQWDNVQSLVWVKPSPHPGLEICWLLTRIAPLPVTVPPKLAATARPQHYTGISEEYSLSMDQRLTRSITKRIIQTEAPPGIKSSVHMYISPLEKCWLIISVTPVSLVGGKLNLWVTGLIRWARDMTRGLGYDHKRVLQ